MSILKPIEKAIKYMGLLSLILALSCTKEETSDCDLFLQFRYDYNLSNEDLFAQQVEEIKVYLFDKDGKYIQTLRETTPAITIPGYKMKIPYEMKGCTAVVWAGVTDAHYKLPVMTLGDGIDKLTLLYNPIDGKSDTKIDNLWHGGPDVLIFPENGETTQTISLVRNTNDFSIRLVDRNGESILSDHFININSSDGAYDHKNQFLNDIQPINYTSYSIVDQQAQLRTLRLLSEATVKLSVTDTDKRVIDMGGKTEIDLVEYLLKSTPSGMPGQEYLDRRYLWDVVLAVDVQSSVALSITINGWIVWFNQEEV